MEQHGISKLDLKRQNRMHVLKILKLRGPTSRIDIAGALELTRAAVTIITNEMIEQGIIVELGEYKHISEKTPRGRKKILIDINHNFKLALGVAIENDNISVGLSTLSGAVLDKRNLDIDSELSREEIIKFVNNSVKEILSDNCIDKQQLLGLGVGVYPGMFKRLGVPLENNVPDYSELKSIFENEMMLPVAIDNSVKGLAMANIDFLKDKDANRRNIAFLQYGDTLHFVVTNLNDPIVSYDNRTDFVDRIIVNPNSTDDSMASGKKGCCKSELSPSAVVRKVSAVYSVENTPYLYNETGGDVSKVTMDLAIKSYTNKDKGSVDIINHNIDLMAVLVNNLYYTTNPQKLVIHNLISLTDEINARLKRTVEKLSGKDVADKITASIIDDKQRFLSGCALAIRELFFDKGGFVQKSKL